MDKYKNSNWKTFHIRRPTKYDTEIGVRAITRNWDGIILAELSANSCQDKRILDIGCATARLLSTLGLNGFNNLAGVDLAPNMIEVAKNKLKSLHINADLKSSDVEVSIPWERNTFDIVVMTGVLHHFSKPINVLLEISRVLQPDGKFILIEPWIPSGVRQLFNIYLEYFPRDGDCRYYSPNEARLLCLNAGFNVLQSKRVDVNSFLIENSRKIQA